MGVEGLCFAASGADTGIAAPDHWARGVTGKVTLTNGSEEFNKVKMDFDKTIGSRAVDIIAVSRLVPRLIKLCQD
jgi:hypothetical protein